MTEIVTFEEFLAEATNDISVAFTDVHIETEDKLSQSMKVKIESFIAFKKENPNKPCGSSKADSPFIAAGNLGGYSHYKITQDLALVYTIKKNVLTLFGVYSHNELGTGTKAKPNAILKMANRFNSAEVIRSEQ